MSLIKNVLRHLMLVTCMGAPLGLLASQGCGLNHDFCEIYCECEICNDREEDDCLIQVQREIDIAEEYECTPEAETYLDCALNDNECDNGDFQIDSGCANDFEDYTECLDDNSDIIGD